MIKVLGNWHKCGSSVCPCLPMFTKLTMSKSLPNVVPNPPNQVVKLIRIEIEEKGIRDFIPNSECVL